MSYCRTVPASEELDFVSRRSAAKLAGVTPDAMVKLVITGRIRVQVLPGEPIGYCREDAEAIARIKVPKEPAITPKK